MREHKPATPVTIAAEEKTDSLAFLVFCAYTFVLFGRPQDYIATLVPLRLALVLTLLTTVVTVARNGNAWSSVFGQRQTRLCLMFFGVMVVGIPFALYRRVTFDAVMVGYIVNVIFFVLFLLHVRTMAAFKRIAYVLTVAVLIFSAVGITQGRFLDGRYVTGSQMFDPNDVAFVTVSLLPFALFVTLGSFRLVSRLMALTAVGLSVVLTLFTGSRGGLLGLITMFLLFTVLRMAKVKKWHKSLLLTALVGLTIFNLDRINVERYLTMGNLQQDYNLSDEFGRTQLWQRGFQIFLRHPLTGVGADNFGEAVGTMRSGENVTPYWQAPHNSYVQVLAETGFFGVVTFVALIVTSLITFSRLRRNAADAGRDLTALPGLLLVGFCALLVSASFLTQAYSVFFTLYFAVAGAAPVILPSQRTNRRA